MHWRTKLVQPQILAPKGFKSLAVPTYRGSTVLFDRQADVVDHWEQLDDRYTYGLYGTPTAMELGARICQLENAHHTFVVPGGQAAIALVYLATCRSGSHVLLPYNAYGPNKEMANGLLKKFGVILEAYDPLIGSEISKLIRPETSLIWTESPGSVTMEVQDIPAICNAAKKLGVPVAIDNTYAAGILFDSFSHGVDISVQALTKYVGGHSDLLLGTVSVRDQRMKVEVGNSFKQLGLAVSPDDCSLALRGLQTLGVRLAQLEKSTIEVAEWLYKNPAIQTVLHPAFPSCPGHKFWIRDFNGSASVFSVLFNDMYSTEQIVTFVESLHLFKIGMSWGGVTSLALVYPDLDRPNTDYAGRLVRFNVGLEDAADLISDLKQAMEKMECSISVFDVDFGSNI